ncbi:MAG: neutral/alkaline non-lysosomal ceramidase N-terminal domain-containing protein [Planctomycetota bacterium]|nr:neutral/alkaline non-lysosomal ceramidase N-terminal domain-containing protein [Planctomycetota bacterium]
MNTSCQIRIAILLSCFLLQPLSAQQGWRYGKAKSSITPTRPMWMSGYGSRNKPAEGKLTDLWAKVLVLKDQSGQNSILITLDLIGIGQKSSRSICKQIGVRHDIPRECIAICTSHTHTGPALSDNLVPLHYLLVDPDQQLLISEYTSWLEKKILQTVDRALNRLLPAHISWGSGKATFAVNRRNNREADVPQLRSQQKLQGPVDHDVPVLAVRDPRGKLQVCLFGYACHATVLSFYKWSGDYPGFAQIQLEKKNPDCQAMFWAGCGADQNPLPRRQVALAEQYGNRLANAVSDVLSRPMQSLSPELHAQYREIELPLSQLPTGKQLKEDSRSKNRFVAARARFLLSQVEGGKPLPASYPYPVQSWKIGDGIQFVTLGGEVVVDFAIRIKKEHRARQTWIAGYSNDVMAYIASRRILREGGYEGATAMIYYGLPAPWAMESEDMIVDEVTRQLK